MRRSRTDNFRSVHFATGFLILLGSTFLPAQSNKKTSSAPPTPAKAAAPAKSVAPAPQKTGSGAQPHVAGQPPSPSSSRPSVAQTPFHPLQEKHAGGIQVPPTSKATQTKTGNLVVTRPNGKVSDVYDAKRGMTIHHGPNGSTRVLVERPDHSRIVAERGRPGYVQRGYSHNGHDYARRTYYFHGRAYDRFYRGYPYRGEYLNVYAPSYYYPAGFYGWAYNPWYSPAVYGWGWAGDPWYGYYGYYFAPSSFYPSASLWLTDYMISSDLSAAYQQQQETPDAGSPSEASTAIPVLTPAVKDMIANEVKNQLALENSEAQQNAQNQEPDPKNSGIARLLTDQQTHVFVVDSPLDLQDTSGNECTLSDGDVLNMLAPPASGAISVNVQVLSSKGSRECAKSDTVTVALIDLQDMQNHMRESIDQGLQELQAKQGQGGLPAAPPSAKSAPVNSAYTADAPPPDPNGATEVNQQLADASEAEKQVLAQAQQQAAPAAATISTTSTSVVQPVAPVSIKLGQSIDEVAASFGQPLKVIDLGSKKTYMYKDMKVIFKDGKVEDVQ